MRIAFKFDELEEDVNLGLETVVFRDQMLRDVYYYEQEPMPSFEDFIGLPLKRTTHEDSKFWVYRQGTYIPRYLLDSGYLYVGHALTSELDASPEPTFEGYHQIDTLLLEGGGKLAVRSDQTYTPTQQRAHFRNLYEDIERMYR